MSFGSADLEAIAGLVESPMRVWKAVSRGLADLWTPRNVVAVNVNGGRFRAHRRADVPRRTPARQRGPERSPT